MYKKFIIILLLFSSLFASIRFLLIGDSISKLGIYPYTNTMFANFNKPWVAVYDSVTNNTGSRGIVTYYNTWIGNQTFDAIIINFGMHDAVGIPWSVTDTSQYKINTSIIADSLKHTNKKVIFCGTTPIIGMYDTCYAGFGDTAHVTYNMAHWDSLITAFNTIAKNVFDSIIDADKFVYVDQFYLAKYNPVWDLTLIHPNTAASNIALWTNIFDTLCKYFNTLKIADPEYSSYGITAADSILTGNSEYSSYGIDGNCFFTIAYPNSSTLADTIGKTHTHAMTLSGCTITLDSTVIIGTPPAGYTITKSTGTIAWSGSGSTGASTILVRSYANAKTDSASVTVTVGVVSTTKRRHHGFRLDLGLGLQ